MVKNKIKVLIISSFWQQAVHTLLPKNKGATENFIVIYTVTVTNATAISLYFIKLFIYFPSISFIVKCNLIIRSLNMFVKKLLLISLFYHVSLGCWIGKDTLVKVPNLKLFGSRLPDWTGGNYVRASELSNRGEILGFKNLYDNDYTADNLGIFNLGKIICKKRYGSWNHDEVYHLRIKDDDFFFSKGQMVFDIGLNRWIKVSNLTEESELLCLGCDGVFCVHRYNLYSRLQDVVMDMFSLKAQRSDQPWKNRPMSAYLVGKCNLLTR